MLETKFGAWDRTIEQDWQVFCCHVAPILPICHTPLTIIKNPPIGGKKSDQ